MNLTILAAGAGWQGFWWGILGLVVGLIAGFFITRAIFTNQLKKNPPINEKMIRAMYMSMGRKPSEADIKRTMAAVNKGR